uniref:Uncharacterized protein n=1 Tax=Rhizophora mucronata TaxID=61149 RepID=A0A2P2P857_RHIMU
MFNYFVVVYHLLCEKLTREFVHLVCGFTITYLHYSVPYGFGATVSTRVSNEPGAGNPEAGKMAVRAMMVLSLAELVVIASVLFSIRRILRGNIFRRQKEIGDHLANMAAFFCLSVIMDSLQTVLSGNLIKHLS